MDFNRENFDKLLVQNTDQQIEIRLLHEKVRYLMKKLFGRSSEKMTPDQMELAFEELRELQDALDEAEEKLEEPAAEKESQRGKRKPLKERIPEDLPTERVVIIPDEVKADPQSYKKIGEETVEELDVTPAQYFRRIIVREK